MNKATMLPIEHKWVEMIFNGNKEYEFRNYPVEGKIYFYETKGKKLGYQQYNDDGFYGDILPYQKMMNELGSEEAYDFHYNNQYAKKVYEGLGMIVGEAVVEYVLDLQIRNRNGKKGDLSKFVVRIKFASIKNKMNTIKYYSHIGCNITLNEENKIDAFNDKYAIKLTNIIKYDKPIPKEEFVLWNKVFCKDFGFIEIDYEKCNCHGMYRYGWENYCTFKNKLEPDMCMGNDLELPLYCPKNTVQSAPQGKIFVVERN